LDNVQNKGFRKEKKKQRQKHTAMID